MRIAITDLTRMAQGYVRAAGVDLHSGARVRPVANGRLSSGLLCTNRGPLDVGNIVDVGSCQPCGAPPETEDCRFQERRLRLVARMSEAAFFDLLSRSAVDSVDGALVRFGNSLAMDRGEGTHSLFILRAARTPEIRIHDVGRGARLRFTWLGGVHLSVTDVRLYESDLVTPSQTKLDGLNEVLRSSPECWLSLGLTRPWRQPGDDRERHYLQLNNVHARGMARLAIVSGALKSA